MFKLKTRLFFGRTAPAFQNVEEVPDFNNLRCASQARQGAKSGLSRINYFSIPPQIAAGQTSGWRGESRGENTCPELSAVAVVVGH